MKNKQKIAVPILADREVFYYLKEKIGERKTKTEAYCDLLDKAISGFVSPFLRKHDYDLLPNQCHVTVSDLALEWHWHRATVRSFLDTMETFGFLKRIRLPKSVVITITVHSGLSIDSYNAHNHTSVSEQFRDMLSDWVIGKASATDVGARYGQLVRQVITASADNEVWHCPDNPLNTEPVYTSKKVTDIQKIALSCIIHAALQKILRKSRFDNELPLVDFFCHDLAGEWADFIEASKDIAGLILDTEANTANIATDEDTECLKSLRKPFLSFLAKACETAD